MGKLRRICFLKAELWHSLSAWIVQGREKGWVPGEMGEEAGLGEAASSLAPPSGGTAHGCEPGLSEAADLFFLGIFLLFSSLLHE